MLGYTTTCSTNDVVNKSNSTYINTRTGRSTKLYSSSTVKYSKFIQGGRYLDLFTTPEASSASSTTGFCVKEYKTSGTSSAYLELGASVGYSMYVPASIEVTNNLTVTTTVSSSATKMVQRLLITPEVINLYNTSSEYNNAI